jgi:hypothetical protein
VNASIEFNQNSSAQLSEVENVRTNRSLPPEMKVFQFPQQLPEAFLSGRWFVA